VNYYHLSTLIENLPKGRISNLPNGAMYAAVAADGHTHPHHSVR
jgi:hypothetical protein